MADTIRADIDRALGDLAGEDWTAPTGAGPSGSGHLLPAETTVAPTVPDPGGPHLELPAAGARLEPYTTAAEARRVFERLAKNAGELTIEISLFLARGGPGLLGFRTPAEAVMAIKEVGKSQAYREVYLAETVAALARAAGADDTRSLARILTINGLNAKAAERLRPRLSELTAAVRDQARTQGTDPQTTLERIVPTVLDQFRAQAPAPPVRASPQVDVPPPRAEGRDEQVDFVDFGQVQCGNCGLAFTPRAHEARILVELAARIRDLAPATAPQDIAAHLERWAQQRTTATR